MVKTEEVVRRFLEGEQEAFNQIVRSWEKKVYNLAWRMLGNREDAQDVVQETFLSVFKSLKALRDPASFSTWLYRITLNHCRTRRRTRMVDVLPQESMAGQTGDGERFPESISRTHVGASLEALDIIYKALAGLNENQRMAIVLKEYMGLTLEEIASVMDCPVSTAKTRLYQGLREVQRNLIRLGVKLDHG